MAINGVVRDALGFASITNTSPFFIANWILISPFICNALAIFSAYSSIVWTIKGDKLNSGNTALLSPLWMPAGSICSITPITWKSSPSKIASISASWQRSKKWSIKILLLGKCFNKLSTPFSSSSSFKTIRMRWPPST